jgi:hypothetical protein
VLASSRLGESAHDRSGCAARGDVPNPYRRLSRYSREQLALDGPRSVGINAMTQAGHPPACPCSSIGTIAAHSRPKWK